MIETFSDAMDLLHGQDSLKLSELLSEVSNLWPPYVIGQAIYIFILSF